MAQDKWDKTDVIVKMISAIFLPFVLLLVGQMYDRRERTSTQERVKADVEASRITTLLRSLASESARERTMALTVAQYFGDRGELPQELLPPIQEMALHDPSAEVAKAAGGALNATAKRNPALASEIQRSVAHEATRVYFEISSEAQRDLAKRLSTALAAGGYSVPGIEVVDVPPDQTQVRFFHAEDKPRAEDLAKRLGAFGLKDVRLHLITGQDRAPVKQLEVWISASQSPK